MSQQLLEEIQSNLAAINENETPSEITDQFDLLNKNKSKIKQYSIKLFDYVNTPNLRLLEFRDDALHTQLKIPNKVTYDVLHQVFSDMIKNGWGRFTNTYEYTQEREEDDEYSVWRSFTPQYAVTINDKKPNSVLLVYVGGGDYEPILLTVYDLKTHKIKALDDESNVGWDMSPSEEKEAALNLFKKHNVR